MLLQHSLDACETILESAGVCWVHFWPDCTETGVCRTQMQYTKAQGLLVMTFINTNTHEKQLTVIQFVLRAVSPNTVSGNPTRRRHEA